MTSPGAKVGLAYYCEAATLALVCRAGKAKQLIVIWTHKEEKISHQIHYGADLRLALVSSPAIAAGARIRRGTDICATATGRH